jgi:hypothetical protein
VANHLCYEQPVLLTKPAKSCRIELFENQGRRHFGYPLLAGRWKARLNGHFVLGIREGACHFGANSYLRQTKPSWREWVAHFPKIEYFLDWEIDEFKKFA